MQNLGEKTHHGGWSKSAWDFFQDLPVPALLEVGEGLVASLGAVVAPGRMSPLSGSQWESRCGVWQVTDGSPKC